MTSTIATARSVRNQLMEPARNLKDRDSSTREGSRLSLRGVKPQLIVSILVDVLTFNVGHDHGTIGIT
jgi:hypothetical protein